MASCPASTTRAAVTAESTPPDRATATRTYALLFAWMTAPQVMGSLTRRCEAPPQPGNKPDTTEDVAQPMVAG